MKSNTLLIAVSVFLVAGCATASSSERLTLIDEPVDCHSAEQNVELLQSARPSSAEQARSVLQMITPVGLVTGALSGSLSDRAKVATCGMSSEIDEKIDAIIVACPDLASSRTDSVDATPQAAVQTRQ